MVYHGRMVQPVLYYVLDNGVHDNGMFVYTHENQFGFKKQHGTDTCIYVMKEIINRYQRLGSSVYLCFLDASKAFDRINHDTLFKKLVYRNVPAYIVRLLVIWTV